MAMISVEKKNPLLYGIIHVYLIHTLCYPTMPISFTFYIISFPRGATLCELESERGLELRR